MSQATITPSQQPPGVSKQLILPFMNAVCDVLKKMAGVDVKVNTPYLKKQSNEVTYDVCGIIGFSGQITGSVVVSFSDVAAMKIVEAFAGMRFERDTVDFADAIGELANMIAGSAKQHLGGVASISVPSVIIGKGYSVAGMSKVPCLVIPCVSPFGDFVVEVCIQRSAAA